MNTIDSVQVGREQIPERAADAVRPRTPDPPDTSERAPAPSEETARPAGPARVPTPEEIQKTAEALQEYVDSIGRELAFEVDRKSGEVVIKVYRKSDGTLIRQIPPEVLMNLREHHAETAGLLVEESA